MPVKIDNNGRAIARESTLARAVLYGYADAQRTIDLMIEEAEIAEAEAERDPGDVMLRKICERLGAALDDQIKAEKKERAKIEALISSVKSDEHRELLALRYIELLSLRECAADIYGSRPDYEQNKDQYLKRAEGIHRRAIAAVEKILTEREGSGQC